MSLNDLDPTLGGNRGIDCHPGVANPTTSSTHANPMKANFVEDPTDETFGAGAGDRFTGHLDAARNFRQTAGVCEGHPGIIESTHIEPLNKQGKDVTDDGWPNATQTRASSGGVPGLAQGAYNVASNAASGAVSMASGVAQSAYKYMTGDESDRRMGK